MKEEEAKTTPTRKRKSRLSEQIDKAGENKTEFQMKKETNLDDLSVFTNFELKEKELTLVEQEQHDHNKIMSTIENLNLSFKNKDKSMFLEGLSKLCNVKSKQMDDTTLLVDNKIKRSLSFDAIESAEYEQQFLNKINHSLTNSQALCNASTDVNSIQSLILQNLETFHQTLKIIVIGDKCVGKSLFISKLIQGDNFDSSFSYQPTKRCFFI